LTGMNLKVIKSHIGQYIIAPSIVERKSRFKRATISDPVSPGNQEKHLTLHNKRNSVTLHNHFGRKSNMKRLSLNTQLHFEHKFWTPWTYCLVRRKPNGI